MVHAITWPQDSPLPPASLTVVRVGQVRLLGLRRWATGIVEGVLSRHDVVVRRTQADAEYREWDRRAIKMECSRVGCEQVASSQDGALGALNSCEPEVLEVRWDGKHLVRFKAEDVWL